jgi:hypothetical protein
MIRDTNDGKKWSTLDKRDLAEVLKGGGDIEEAATFLCRAGTVGEVAHTAAELGLLTDADAKYSVELFSDLGGLERELARKDQLELARSLYKLMVEEYRGRLVMLCDGGRVLARSDQSDTMPL